MCVGVIAKSISVDLSLF